MADFVYEQARTVADSNEELGPHIRSVIKEILHHHIVRALNDCGYLRDLTFIGGTCLRLCHGGIRFSEDLDFRGGNTTLDSLEEGMGRELEGALLKRGLNATVRRPEKTNQGNNPVRRWWVRVVVREKAHRDEFSVERIKLDIDSRPKPEVRENVPLMDRFGGLGGELSEGSLIPCLPMMDICADKLEALPVSIALRPENPRYRDIFDLAWALPKLDGAALVARAKESASRRGVMASTHDAISRALPQLSDIVHSVGFQHAMVRFLPKSTADRTVSNPDYRRYAAQALGVRLEQLRDALEGGNRLDG